MDNDDRATTGNLGWKLAVLYVAVGLIVVWFGGIVTQWFKPKHRW